MMIKRNLIVTSLSVILSACGGGSDGSTSNSDGENTFGDTDIAALVNEIVDSSVVPSAANFATAADELAGLAGSFCVSPTASDLALVQGAWLSAQHAWFRLASYNFGPLTTDIVFPEYTFIDSLRLRGTNYLETVRGDIAESIANDTELDESYFEAQTFQNTGLLALEVLVYESSDELHSQQATDIVDEFINAPRKCELLIGQADLLALRANKVSDTWRGGFRDTFVDVGLDDGSEPIVILIQSMQNYMDYLHARTVVTVTAQVSQENWSSIAAAAAELENYLEGSSQNGGFLAAMNANNNAGSVTVVRSNLSALQEAIADQNVNAVELAFQALDGNLKREIPAALDVELGITFSDGD